jgi:hypothetical protein
MADLKEEMTMSKLTITAADMELKSKNAEKLTAQQDRFVTDILEMIEHKLNNTTHDELLAREAVVWVKYLEGFEKDLYVALHQVQNLFWDEGGIAVLIANGSVQQESLGALKKQLIIRWGLDLPTKGQYNGRFEGVGNE